MGTRSFFQSMRRRWSVDESADDAPDTGRVSSPCRHCARVRWFVGGMLLAAALLVLHASAQSPAAAPASSASDTTTYVATPRPLPPRPEQPIASAPLPASAASAAASAAGRDPMWLVYQTIPLPSGRLDRPYKARDLVRGGRPPYRIAIDGALPPGMFVEEDGALAGTPTKTGTFRFLLTATDASRTRNLEQALYEIRVVDPKPAPVARPAAAPASVPARAPATARARPPNPLTSITEDQTNRVVPADPPMPMTYVLTEAKLAEIFKNAEASAGESLMTAAAAGEAAAEGEPAGPKALAVKPPVMGPTLDQLREMLMPLKDVEHPTRAVFQDSLRARQCEYFLRHVNELTRELDKDQIQRCPRKEDLAERDREPPPLRPSPGSGRAPDQDNAIDGRIAAAELERKQQLEKEKQQQKQEEKAAKPGQVPTLPPGRLAVDTFLDMLMPATLREEITDAAGVEHPMTGVKPLNLVPEDCGCSLQAIETDVYAFLPFWMQGASDAAIPVRFDKFTRMQYMGAVLRNDGSYQAPPGVESPGGGFARRVNQHDVGLDLVLYRRDFHVLMRLVKPARDDVLANSAAAIGAMLDIRHSDLQGRFEALLPPGWREEAHVYDGLTVFFEPTDAEAEDPRFERFFIDYVQSLVTQMQKRAPRAFQLNLVIPQHLLGEKGTAFRFRNLLAIMKTAERNRAEASPGEYKERGAATASYKSTPDYVGKSPITVRILTPLGMGSDVNKMQLRNRTDFTDELSGPDRMALLVSVMPVLVYPGGKPVDFVGAESMDRDLVYIGWSFGGVAFWPLPVSSIGAGKTVVELLDTRFWSFLDQDTRFCKIVCPMRMPLRLGLEALLVIVGTTLLLYGWNCRVRRMGHVILMVLWAGALVTLAVASAIFSCDPSLNQLRTGNTLLVVIILVLIVGGLIVTFKPRVEAP
ncbi:Ig domain-containing protein [Roseateles sp. UC29_93]|uniref:Ig domain-containing protein n=1 Tax=Roseateles sp. UC29_93 TaxID=3350177 RepID=UPI00366FD700